jgi:hypothetical protein
MSSSHVFDHDKWAKLSLFEQMGNIGSEVGRTMNAMQKGDKVSMQGAYYRSLDLIDATIASWSSMARRKELLRAREELTVAVESQTVDRRLDNYFMQYAIAARAGQ